MRVAAPVRSATAKAEPSGLSARSGLLQRKLAVGASNDPLELEADRIADQLLAAPAHPVVNGTPPRIQRFSGHSYGQMDAAPASVDRVLASPGRPLEPALRRDMGQRFGHDFASVRVHADAAAEQSAWDVNANAYTVGQDIVFGAGRFAPGTQDGRRLIAHELTHVVQQSQGERFATGPTGEKRGLSPNNARTCAAFGVIQRQVARQPQPNSSARVTYIHDAVDQEVWSRIASIEELREREREGLPISEELFAKSAGDDVYEAAYNKANQDGLVHGLNPLLNASELSKIGRQAGRKAIRDLFMANRAAFHGKFWDEHHKEWEKQQQQATNEQAKKLSQEKLDLAVYDLLYRVNPTTADADKAIQLLEYYFSAGGDWHALTRYGEAPLHRLLDPYGYRDVEGSGGHTPGENVGAWQQDVLETALVNWRQSTERQRESLRKEYWASDMHFALSPLAAKYQHSTTASEGEIRARNAQEVAGLPLPHGGQYSGPRGGYQRAIQQVEVHHALEQLDQIANAGPASLLGRIIDGERGAAVGAMIDAGLAIYGGARARAKVRAYDESGGNVVYGGPGGAGFEPVSGQGVPAGASTALAKDRASTTALSPRRQLQPPPAAAAESLKVGDIVSPSARLGLGPQRVVAVSPEVEVLKSVTPMPPANRALPEVIPNASAPKPTVTEPQGEGLVIPTPRPPTFDSPGPAFGRDRSLSLPAGSIFALERPLVTPSVEKGADPMFPSGGVQSENLFEFESAKGEAKRPRELGPVTNEPEYEPDARTEKPVNAREQAEIDEARELVSYRPRGRTAAREGSALGYSKTQIEQARSAVVQRQRVANFEEKHPGAESHQVPDHIVLNTINDPQAVMLSENGNWVFYREGTIVITIAQRPAKVQTAFGKGGKIPTRYRDRIGEIYGNETLRVGDPEPPIKLDAWIAKQRSGDALGAVKVWP